MGGPALGLLFLEPVDLDAVLAEVVEWLEGFCESIRRDTIGIEFAVVDGSAVGMPELAPGSACGMFLELAEIYEDADFSTLPRRPVDVLTLGVYCSGDVNHRLLGRVALTLARRFGTVIDFDGDLGRAATGLPGTVWEVRYLNADGEDYSFQVGDADFLEAWLRHPAYRLIK